MSEQDAAAYVDLRIRLLELVSSVDATELNRAAPATPGWRVRDVLAHVVGVADDVVAGRIEGIASDEWTAAQVEKRRAVPVGELFDEWSQCSPAFEGFLTTVPTAIAGQALYDAATHEHDIRHALGQPGARDSDAMRVGWEWLVAARTNGGGSAIRLVTETRDDVAGAGEPAVTVQAPFFELFRATTGRRTPAEVRAYAWVPEPDLDAVLAADFFTLRTESLDE